MESEIIVREYRTKDAKDILSNEYPWEASFGTIYKDLELKFISFLEGRPRKRFVAYSLKENVAVGTLQLDRITRNLWHSGGWFVSPSYRRRGIGSLLIEAVHDYLRIIAVKKVVANIELNNFPSIRTAVKAGWRFFSQAYYQCDAGIKEELHEAIFEGDNGITLTNFHKSSLDILYRIYKSCLIKEWRNFLEIDKDNFLERFFGYTRARGLLKLWVKNKVMVIKERGDIIGYVQYTLPLRKPMQKTVYLYLLPTSNAINILGKILNLLKMEGYEEASLVLTNKNRIFMEETADILQNSFHFKKAKFLVCYYLLK